MRFAGIAAAALVGTTMAAPLPSEKVNHLEKRLNIGKLFSGINWPDVVTRFTSSLSESKQAAQTGYSYDQYGQPIMTGNQASTGPTTVASGTGRNAVSFGTTQTGGNFFNPSGSTSLASNQVATDPNYPTTPGTGAQAVSYGTGNTGAGAGSSQAQMIAQYQAAGYTMEEIQQMLGGGASTTPGTPGMNPGTAGTSTLGGWGGTPATA